MKKPLPLKISEFYNIYGISLLLNKGYDDILLPIILPIAKKYYEITNYAVRKEILHISDPWPKKYTINNLLLIKYNIKNINKENSKISLEIIEKLFKKAKWDVGYGDLPWAKITKECIKLEKLLKNPNLNKLIIQLDYMNDLEHNNALYLKDFCSFGFDIALYIKYEASINFILKKCSKKIQLLYSQIIYKTNSSVAKYHEG
ncbi:MAG: hypothetical protein WC516_09605 [Patescibacteria group bacterium]|jgi:hypothetical protein